MAEATLSGATHPILENDYASEWMGIKVLALSDGHATIRMTLRQEMLNGFDMAHGGMIFAFADTAFALACNPAAPAAGPLLNNGETPGDAGTVGTDGTADAAAPTDNGATTDAAGSAGAGSDSIIVASGVDINFLKPAFRAR